MAYDLAIVLPTFNESNNVGPMVDRLATALAGIHYEVIFVDDDSPDGTADVCAGWLASTTICVCCTASDDADWPRRASREFWPRRRPLSL